MSNIQLLLNAVDKQIDPHSLDISNSEILHLIGLNFYELDTPKFSILLSSKVVKPIAEKIEWLKQRKNDLGSGRTNFKQRRAILSNINNLKDLLRDVFKEYNINLKENEHFQEYKKEENEKYSKYEDEILKGNLDDNLMQSIMYPTYFDFEKMQILRNIITEKIKSLNLDKDNYEFAKDRTKSFYSRIKDSIYTISKSIDKTNADLKETIKKLIIIKEDEVFEDYENSITYNLKDFYSELEIELSFNLDNLESHKTLLADILKDLTKSYPYLEDLGGFTPSKKTVFGNSNFEVINQLALELKQEGFVSTQTTLIDLIAVFTKSDSEEPINKINLTNGTLNDFGYLLLKMKPFFDYPIKAQYSEWWSERFLFNLKPKDKKSVSNMVSNIEKGVRFPSKKQSLSKIIESLNPIPH